MLSIVESVHFKFVIFFKEAEFFSKEVSSGHFHHTDSLMSLGSCVSSRSPSTLGDAVWPGMSPCF